MEVVAFIDPPQGRVIEKILRGLWHPTAPRGPPGANGLVQDLDSDSSDSQIGSPDQADQSQELTYVDINSWPPSSGRRRMSA